MCSPLHLGAKHGVTLGAPVQLTLIAVLYSKVDLNVHLGIKDLLAQSTPVQMMGMNIHQMFLKFIWLREQLHTSCTTIFRGDTEVMGHNVLLKLLLIWELQTAMLTRQAGNTW